MGGNTLGSDAEHATALRDHGRPNLGTPVGAPKAETFDGPGECPNCGCDGVMRITVKLKDVKQLKGGKGVGIYIGCPACPWASPMMARAQTW